MPNRWREKNVGISLRKGTSQKKPVTDERDGTVAGYHEEHWDDHVDAVAQPKAIKLKARVVKEDG
jgi:hypothetical protein